MDEATRQIAEGLVCTMRNESIVKKVLPVSLLIEDKPCLIVGGGAIAARKIGHLLAAGAEVTVVSPDLSPDIARWKKSRKVRHTPRAFKVGDVMGQFVVFAATDNKDVNLCVIKACQRRRILCCASDTNWAVGDFMTPAIIRHSALTVAVSTGGQSCTRARRVKERLEQVIIDEKL